MAQSTVKPDKIKILGEKVYVRDLSTLTQNEDENGTIMYFYDEEMLSKDEFIQKQNEQNDLQVKKQLSLPELIKQYRWIKQKWFAYDGHTQRFQEYDIQRMQISMQSLSDNIVTEIEWAYPIEDAYVTITDPTYFTNMLMTGFANESKLRKVEKQLLSDDTVTLDNYKDKFDELMSV